MKVQISNLRSGTKNQLLNEEIDYTTLPKSTSHVGHAGTSNIEVNEVFQKVLAQNPNSIKIRLKEFEIELTANYSISGNFKCYSTTITDEELIQIAGLKPSKRMNPFISIYTGNLIEIGNGKNSFIYICPSLITIL